MGGPEGGWGHKQTRASKYGGGGGRRPWGLVLTRKRFVHGAAALGGKLYVVGGYDVGEDTPLAEAEVFDPRADGWHVAAAAEHANGAPCLGGRSGSGQGLRDRLDDDSDLIDAVEAYDPLSGAWTQVASLPVPLYHHTAAAVDGKIYVLGGHIDDDDGEEVVTGHVVMYDPAADSWQQMAAMPTARHGHAAAVMDGKIYVSGGFTTSRELSDAFEAYDPVMNTWTTLASLSKVRADHASAAFNGKLYVFGGVTSGDGLVTAWTWWRSTALRQTAGHARRICLRPSTRL
jgi:N-acetylneuraminic acid mutarotase